MNRTKEALAVALTMSVIGLGRAEAQVKIQPAPIQSGTYHGINQTPWFSTPEFRQKFNLDAEQYARLNKAYQDARARYYQEYGGMDKNLTAEQRMQRTRELQQGFHQNFGNTINTVITDPGQRQRYNQLYTQYRGIGAFEDPAVAKKLDLTQQQRDKFGKAYSDWTKQMNEIAANYQTNRAGAARRFEQLQFDTNRNINSMLTPAQQKTWQQMTGNQYTFQPNAYFQAKTIGGKQ